METIGLLGGISWQSTLVYYRLINEAVTRRLGGLHSASLVISSLDFHEIVRLQKQAHWTQAPDILIGAARKLEAAGASVLVLCTNTMHILAPQIDDAIAIPLIHIADVTASEVKKTGIRRAGLLGTRFTMEEDLYKDRLHRRHSLDVITPERREAAEVHRIIFEELCRGAILESSRRTYTRIIERLAEDGAEGVLLGCTEIPLLIDRSGSPIPVFDTTKIHAFSAVDHALDAPSVPTAAFAST